MPEKEIDCNDIGAKVAMVYSLPRLAFTDNMFCAIRTSQSLGIHAIKHTGAWWDQSLTLAIEEAITRNVEWVLTVDYDTVFTPQDVLRLYALTKLHPQIDAIAPLQMRREAVNILMAIRAEDGSGFVENLPADIFDGEMIRVTAAHFGCTLIRVDALNRMPKPWFVRKADADGGWGKDHIDSDIMFWRRWERVGNSLFVANRVPVGHMQIVVSWPGADYQPHLQLVGDYDENGMPPEVRRK